MHNKDFSFVSSTDSRTVEHETDDGGIKRKTNYCQTRRKRGNINNTTAI
jgi:hypothetical protein